MSEEGWLVVVVVAGDDWRILEDDGWLSTKIYYFPAWYY